MPDFTPFLVAGLATAATYVLSGVGIVVLYRASGVVNFAQGAVGALAAFISWSIVERGGPAEWSWIGGIAAAVAVSFLYGRVIAPRLSYSDPIMRAVATLSFALILMGFMGYVWGEAPRRLRLPTDTMSFDLMGVRVTMTRAVAFALGLLVTCAVMAFLSYSRVGLQMRALASSRELSAMLGVRVFRVDGWAWVISGALAGVSGVLLADLQRLSGQALTFAVIPAIAAAVVGRFASLPATVAGGLAIGVCEALLTPVPIVGPFRTAVPFLFAVGVLLWMQRKVVFVYR
ncbi:MULTISPECIES: branched-chain amino acid ABC transporter permease [unclassified Bradyrhizobium]|uniref:branched-chain amino acid ABC transporter permease n=1 Tax=unclassified Bradyrhizobium TaxID=2631580 RepID=UPI001BA5A8EA|nr:MULTISPECIES: branched-chain amino acid ABC transporter permease [unclassified Bradyrhizobium]MBR1205611.1 branched-chain amino acid ABC transporter permease [Bradyrhizobium sp. AUGA SZCCT0124]MBR1313940.1 branched-chain amino acid ABC transporter permease [Bradyrhizobium sp. AUGA SZCCT0051]MBR1337938.1 branched-chain amino acid ABC transporter permease [Bradyrhizobium sp. AUGA SZCCT0105]MBR1355593.1 branched-chain amino acid ABC transporter permease [Bradyrhizobium sp. AUGA SZCCT0045]